MRDVNRISRMLIKLDIAWKKYPDYRLGQMVSNLLGPGPHDVFFLEDDEWEKLIEAHLTKKEINEVKKMSTMFGGPSKKGRGG